MVPEDVEFGEHNQELPWKTADPFDWVQPSVKKVDVCSIFQDMGQPVHHGAHDVHKHIIHAFVEGRCE
jgi:hypothetical protein